MLQEWLITNVDEMTHITPFALNTLGKLKVVELRIGGANTEEECRDITEKVLERVNYSPLCVPKKHIYGYGEMSFFLLNRGHGHDIGTFIKCIFIFNMYHFYTRRNFKVNKPMRLQVLDSKFIIFVHITIFVYLLCLISVQYVPNKS